MQIRCFKCHMPISLGREAVSDAMVTVEKDNRLNILLEEAMIDLLEKDEEESE